MKYKVFGVYSPEVLKTIPLASIEAQTERAAIAAFREYVIKRCKVDGRKFAKNYSLKKDRALSASHTIYTIGANTLGGVSLWFVEGTDYSSGETIAKIPFPKAIKGKAKK